MVEPSPRTTGSLDALLAIGASAETLWTRLAPSRTPGALRRILFVGTEHGCGTSTSACSAAAGLTRNLQAKVVLVEVAAGPSTLAGMLGLPEGPGFHELLAGRAGVGACLNGCGLDGLAVVTAGRGALAAGQLASEPARRIFAELGAGRDFLLIDAAPLHAHPELQLVLRHVDDAVLVLEAGRTQREEALELKQVIERAGVPILGSVVNQARAPRPRK